MALKNILYVVLLFIFVGCFASPEKISLDFKNIETRELLQMLAGYSNKSVIIDEKIDGEITVSFKQVFWHEALNTVLSMKGLIKYDDAATIVIMPASRIENNSQAFLQSKVLNLKYVSAEKVLSLLSPMNLLSSHGKLGAGEVKNSLIVTDVKENIGKIEEIIKRIDVKPKQVLIEARIVSADEKFSQDLGVELGSSQESFSNKDGRGVSAVNLRNGQFNFKVAKFVNNAVLDLELAALESEGRGKVISKPKLLTTDGQTAYVESGAEIPYQEKSKGGNTSVAFKKAVLSLKVTPKVTQGDSIDLFLELSQDKVGQLLVKGVPTIDTRKINTKVLVSSNETVVLGGIYEWSKSNSVSSVPFLGDIPLIKYLFSKKESKVERKELLMFVTPRVLY